ncbi:MAG: glycosyltransferase family 4 protein [Candidatus Shapirobacteria bacterium]|nr:glycosyltransferase family 4 protein [Candidatus Shapirobacteria bacterium]MDD4410485.1 glycosyltransferase family 4 protein [Candidatus Shapirobacteria bacterium]
MTQKRKILMITPYLPRRAQSGGQNSSYYSIKYLAAENDITLICFSRDQEGLEEIKQFCKKVIVVKRGKTWELKKILYTGFSTYPFLVANYISNDLKQTIATELDNNKYDLIHCECFYLMPNIPKTKIPIVLVDQTIEFAVYEHYIKTVKSWKKLIYPFLWFDVLKLKYWETYYWKNTHTVVAFAQEDQKIISKITGRKDIELFQNGVDNKFFESKPKTVKSKFPSILFGVSNMKWMQNRESVEMIIKDSWPAIKKAIPECKFYIIGRSAPDYYAHYRTKDIIVEEADFDGGEHDPMYYYQYCWALVAPMGSGGGSRNKFLEAMACRLPIITTPEGMGGIKIENFKQSIICDYKDVAGNTINLLKNDKKRITMGEEANKLISGKYSYQNSVKGLNQIYKEITKK